MKDIEQLIQEVQTNPEFRANFAGKDEAELEQFLKDEGYDVSMDQIIEAAENIDIELSPEELEKIAGGKSAMAVISSVLGVAIGVGLFLTGCTQS